MALYVLLEREGERERPRRPRIFRDRSNPLDWMNDDQIIANYRLTREVILELVDDMYLELQPATKRNNAIESHMQILITLRYYATGSFYGLIAEGLGISKSSVSVIIDRVTKAICARRNRYIKFPMDRGEQRRVKAGFFRIASFPNVIGAVDGTLIAIRPPVEHEPTYVCRKNFHALNVQIVCDSDQYITNIVAKWPGSSHDSFVFQNSELSMKFETGQIEGGYLLGDSGYGLKPYLLTPFLNPESPPQERYNTAHTKTRNIVERCIGLLKSRYRCLHHKTAGCLMRNPSNNAKIIIACAVLHNICVKKQIPHDLIVNDDTDDNNIDDNFAVPRDVIGATARNDLVRERFT